MWPWHYNCVVVWTWPPESPNKCFFFFLMLSHSLFTRSVYKRSTVLLSIYSYEEVWVEFSALVMNTLNGGLRNDIVGNCHLVLWARAWRRRVAAGASQLSLAVPAVPSTGLLLFRPISWLLHFLSSALFSQIVFALKCTCCVCHNVTDEKTGMLRNVKGVRHLESNVNVISLWTQEQLDEHDAKFSNLASQRCS